MSKPQDQPPSGSCAPKERAERSIRYGLPGPQQPFHRQRVTVQRCDAIIPAGRRSRTGSVIESGSIRQTNADCRRPAPPPSPLPAGPAPVHVARRQLGQRSSAPCPARSTPCRPDPRPLRARAYTASAVTLAPPKLPSALLRMQPGHGFPNRILHRVGSGALDGADTSSARAQDDPFNHFRIIGRPQKKRPWQQGRSRQNKTPSP